MPSKTIYLNVEDLAFIEAHRDEIGGSLSSALMEGLRMVIEKRKLEATGFEEIRVDVGGPGAPRLKVFPGRLVVRANTTENSGTTQVSRRLYTTPKGFWVYFERSSVNWNYWTGGGGQASGDIESFDPSEVENRRIFEVRPSLDELTELAPAELIAQARAETDDNASHIEHLDL
ncbi:hypothetical protein DP939_39270 [Spongiactinospora rosea]|uniref:EXLDI protein n=1 Tax=Spongiactinospora rosea TaxID=2248750 RepID=A0A366LNB2_9ACTN|nr:EXLDI protein [Spongiactinospora rosea]RBQ14652.1 hypothetical protein DP939_39270 [Spongiactinospora rosea]